MRKTVRYVKGVDDKVNSSDAAVKLFYPSFRRLDHEEVWIILTDKANNPIVKRLSTVGGLSSTIFDIRRIVKDALTFNAAGVIVCHNHMSDVEPSSADIKQTENLRKALNLFDIGLTDHLIVNEIEYYSFSEDSKHKLPDS